ncbi:hypothetical protein TNIN_110981 [Trichonephila inaurata madagascariensis]|uniref:Uncharacterized protein n=1 Tax=Trichonephila inaurata madagascariensis TaxID=2747483 RepID=A0A8X6XC34_9ARAC|nr:hypothetical protein TNIN_110981 [Trichonephila inaurata madagascariensis]
MGNKGKKNSAKFQLNPERTKKDLLDEIHRGGNRDAEVNGQPGKEEKNPNGKRKKSEMGEQGWVTFHTSSPSFTRQWENDRSRMSGRSAFRLVVQRLFGSPAIT